MSEEDPSPSQQRKVRCFYEILSIPMDADASMIKKAHRKLALKWHPDKNQENLEQANNEFRLVQQAYECLSDPNERAWYDEHRDSILRGWTASQENDSGGDMLFDIEDYQHPSCFAGFDDDEEDNFYQVYTTVFTKIAEGEISASPNIPLSDLELMFPTNFGNSTSDYKTVVSPFYAAWDNFSTRLTFAWEDKYDTRDAEHRRIRKAMEGENRKYRKTARKERNEDVLNLVEFVKKMDPRVKAYKELLKLEKQQKQKEEQKDAERRRIENKLAKEKWMEQRQKEIEEEEKQMMMDTNNRARFMFRLDDESDEDTKKKGKKKKKKGKKGKQGRYDGKEDHHHQYQEQFMNHDEPQNVPNHNGQDMDSEIQPVTTPESCTPVNPDIHDPEVKDINMEMPASDMDGNHSDDSDDSDDSDEPEVWKCVCCRKEFKSEKQLENHFKSKKHKDAWKKYQKKQSKPNMETKHVKQEEVNALEKDLAMEDLMNELEVS